MIPKQTAKGLPNNKTRILGFAGISSSFFRSIKIIRVIRSPCAIRDKTVVTGIYSDDCINRPPGNPAA
jgi:hypothetical protein